jgi:hypothetical protein
MNARFIQVAVWLFGTVLAPLSLCAAEPQEIAAPDKPLPAEVRRPYRGLFGANDQPRRKHSVTFTGSGFAAYDDDVFADTGAPTPMQRRDGMYGGVTASLDYARTSRVFADLTGTVGLNKYGDRTPVAGYRAAGAVGMNGSRGAWNAGGSAGYSSEFRLGVFVDPLHGGIADPFQSISADYDLYNLAAYRTTLGATATRTIGRRSTLSGFYGRTDTLYVHGPYDYSTQGAGAVFSRGLTRHLTFRAGYQYGMAHYATPTTRPRGMHTVDLGLEYGRALSVSRRTRFGFTTGSALYSSNVSSIESTGGELMYRFIGTANLTHEMGRTWTAALSYRRGVDFHEGFYDPFLSDAVGGTLHGLFSRRVAFTAEGNYSFGKVGFGSDNHYSSSSTTAQLQFALTRTLAAYAGYFYYRYRFDEFDEFVFLDPRFARALERQGARAGLMATVPLIR